MIIICFHFVQLLEVTYIGKLECRVRTFRFKIQVMFLATFLPRHQSIAFIAAQSLYGYQTDQQAQGY